MRNRILLFIVALATYAPSIAQGTLSLKSMDVINKPLKTMPTRDIDFEPDGVTVTYRFENIELRRDPLFAGKSFVGIEGFFQNHVNGEPAYLNRWDTFVVDGEDAKVVVLDSVFAEYPLELSPARPILPYGVKQVYTKDIVKPVIAYNGLMPSSVISEIGKNKYRENDLLEVCVSPVQYDYKRKMMRVCKELRYKVCFNTNIGRDVGENSHNFLPDDDFLANITLNARNSIRANTSSTATMLPGSHYLIISVPKYTEAVNRFAEWKRTLGFDVHLDIRTAWLSSTEVKQAVRDAYFDYDICHFLIIGGHDDVPGQIATYGDYSYVTDLYYGCIDAGYTPDIYRGRLPATTSEEANVIVDKIIGYEKNPCTDSSMYETSIHCALFEDEDSDSIEDTRNIFTSERIRNHVMQQGKHIKRIYHAFSNWPKYYNQNFYANGQPLPPDLLKPGFTWVADSTNITDSINNKAFYVIYLGHGDFDEWGAPGYKVSNISSLNNGNALPVVFSMACLTGNYRYPDCFCETFLKRSGGGCVAIYGNTHNSFSGFSDVLAEGMFDSIWPSSNLWPAFQSITPINTPAPTPTYRLGQIMDQGLRRVVEAYHRSYERHKIKIMHEILHCFGDPSMMIHTDTPTSFNNASILRSNGMINVSTGGETAKITYYNRRTGVIESYSGTIHSYPDDPEISVCISAHNKIPYIDGGTLFIQNQTLSDNGYYEAHTIKVGNQVTSTQSQGDVNFTQGHHQLVGKEVELHPGTTVSTGATLEIRNN